MEFDMFLMDHHRWVIGVSVLLNVFFAFMLAIQSFTGNKERQFDVKISESKRGLFRWYILEKDGTRSAQCTGSFKTRHLCEVDAVAILGNVRFQLV